jgi:hypothetical protein
MNAAVCHVSHEGRSILATVAPWILGGPPSKCDLDDVVNRRQSDSAAWLRQSAAHARACQPPRSSHDGGRPAPATTAARGPVAPAGGRCSTKLQLEVASMSSSTAAAEVSRILGAASAPFEVLALPAQPTDASAVRRGQCASQPASQPVPRSARHITSCVPCACPVCPAPVSAAMRLVSAVVTVTPTCSLPPAGGAGAPRQECRATRRRGVPAAAARVRDAARRGRAAESAQPALGAG